MRHSPENDFQNDRLPDVALTLDTESLIVEEGAITGMPDLAVEIKSPSDSNRALRAKADFYLDNGSTMVWLIYPDQKLVEVYEKNGDILILTENDTISGGVFLPDFTLPVKKLFTR
ncbi:MAG: Uma2 family endonuclease [Aggregatilineales bacterium]